MLAWKWFNYCKRCNYTFKTHAEKVRHDAVRDELFRDDLFRHGANCDIIIIYYN